MSVASPPQGVGQPEPTGREIVLNEVQNVAVNANRDIFARDTTPQNLGRNESAAITIDIAHSVATDVSYTLDSTTFIKLGSIRAGELFEFMFRAKAGSLINVRVSDAGTIRLCAIGQPT